MVEEGLAPMAADTSAYFLDRVDGVINTARHGDNHYEYSMPYIRAGVPMFIDKPFCVSSHNAREMIDEAEKAGALLCGGSSLRFAPEMLALKQEMDSGALGPVRSASLSAPVNLSNPYGNFFFYSGHLAQMLIDMFGLPLSVYAAAREKTITVLCRYAAHDAVLHYTVNDTYSITLHTDRRNHYVTLTPCDEPLLDEFCDMLRNKTQPRSYEALAAPVTLLEAIYISYTSGTEQPVKPIR